MYFFLQLEEESTDQSSDDSSYNDDDDDHENVVSFRDSEFTQSHYEDDEEGGDIGLGQYSYNKRQTSRQDESAL